MTDFVPQEIDPVLSKHFTRFFPEIRDERKRRFLAAYAATGGIRKAARLVGISPGVHYIWLAFHDSYETAFARAKEISVDVVEEKVFGRGTEGFDVPIIYKGQITGWYKEFSDRAAEIWLQGNSDRYKRNSQSNLTAVKIEINTNIPFPGVEVKAIETKGE